jgi:hypothetical protein
MFQGAEINGWAVFLGGVLAMGIGFAWYSPILFGKLWARLTGTSVDGLSRSPKSMAGTYLAGFAGSLVMSAGIGYFIYWTAAATWVQGLETAFVVWAGFVVPVQLATVLWERKPPTLFLVNVSYYLVILTTLASLFVFLQ